MALNKLLQNVIEDGAAVQTVPGRSRLKRNEKPGAKGAKNKLTPLQEAIMVKPAASTNPKPVGGNGKPGVPYGKNPPFKK